MLSCAQQAKTAVRNVQTGVFVSHEMLCILGQPDGLHVFLHDMTNKTCF